MMKMQGKKTSAAVPTFILPRIFSGSILIPVPKKKKIEKKKLFKYDHVVIKGKIR